MEKYGVNIRWTSRFDYARGGRLNPHEHDHYQLIYFIDGEGTFTLGETPHPLGPGACFLIPPQVRHSFVTFGRAKVRTLDLKFDIRDAALLEAARQVPGAQNDDAAQTIRLLLEKIRSEGVKKEAYFGELACLTLASLLYTLARRHGEPASRPPAQRGVSGGRYEPLEAARRLQRYIQEHYAEELALGEIAERLAYSRNYLSQSFRHNFGVTFTAYVRTVRIQEAKTLMAYSSLSLKEIAARVGFKTIHHFSRVFKEQEGLTPGEWKQREQEGVRKDVLFD